MDPRPQYQAAARGEEEIETGEPIEADEQAVGKKIPGRRPFTARPAGEDNGYPTPPPKPGEGRMVLSSARYLQKNPDPEVERENRKKRREEKEQREGDGGPLAFEQNVFNGGVLGGILAMVGAAVWFVVGLANDVLFFYPPILFLVGLGAFLKGLFGVKEE